jgi:plasmid replication initiation protein
MNDGELRENLDLVEEVRLNAVVRNEVLKSRVVR